MVVSLAISRYRETPATPEQGDDHENPKETARRRRRDTRHGNGRRCGRFDLLRSDRHERHGGSVVHTDPGRHTRFRQRAVSPRRTGERRARRARGGRGYGSSRGRARPERPGPRCAVEQRATRAGPVHHDSRGHAGSLRSRQRCRHADSHQRQLSRAKRNARPERQTQRDGGRAGVRCRQRAERQPLRQHPRPGLRR